MNKPQKCALCGQTISSVTYGPYGPTPRTAWRHVGNRFQKTKCKNPTPKRDCICLRCDSETFIHIPNAVIEQHFNGVQLFVTSPGIVCSNCGWLTVNINQIDELVRNTKAAYEAHKNRK